LSEADFRRLLPVCCPSRLVGRALYEAPGKTTDGRRSGPSVLVRVVDVWARRPDAVRPAATANRNARFHEKAEASRTRIQSSPCRPGRAPGRNGW
jgi:hypothetical protein